MSKKPTFRHTLLGRIAPIAILILASGGLAAQQAVSSPLSGDAEVPAVVTSATGSVNITIRPDRTVSGTVETTGITATMAHIHEGAAGKVGPPVVTLVRSTDNSFAVPADTKLTEAQYASYTAGRLYVNVHSAAHPNGEIRAQLSRPSLADVPARSSN